MNRAVIVPLVCFATAFSASAQPRGRGKVDVRVVVTPAESSVPAGGRGEVSFLLSPPEGIKINRFPPVRLSLTPPEGVELDASELRQGSDQPIADPEDFPFKTLEPLRVGFSVRPERRTGKARVDGKIKFVYCVAASGFCVPVTRDVGFDVTVTPPRAN